MKLVVDATAWKDLDDIANWIARDNPVAARQVLAAILQTIDQLERFPRLARPGRAHGSYERVVVGTPYIIVLQSQEDREVVIVTAVAHGARNR